MRLLIVEDDPKLADVVARGLRAERFAVDVAEDGLKGQSLLDTYAYDLLILDLMLPRMSGGELLVIEHVWDQSFEGLTNIVDVYVRYLRRKIDDDSPRKLIHTVRGVGYCVRSGT